MKFNNYLQEEYKLLVDKTPIYTNPSSADFKEIYKEALKNKHTYGVGQVEVRFIIDTRNFKLYVWDAYDIIHNEVLRQVSTSSILFAGMGLISNNSKITILDIWERESNSYPEPEYNLKGKWEKKRDKLKNLEKYFDDPLIEKIEDYYREGEYNKTSHHYKDTL